MSSPRSAEVVGQGQPVRVALLGSTGSIGRQAVAVLVGDPAFRVVALAAGRNTSPWRRGTTSISWSSRPVAS